MRVAVLSSISRRIEPRYHGSVHRIVWELTEGLAEKGVEVTLFATADSLTSGNLHAVVPGPLNEDAGLDESVWTSLHVCELFQLADRFDIIHNHLDWFPLSWSTFVGRPVLTTIYGRIPETILPAYEKCRGRSYYVSTSDKDRSPELDYLATIPPGIDLSSYPFNGRGGDYLLSVGGIHPEKGIADAVEIARGASRKLVLAGPIEDEAFFRLHVEPHLNGDQVTYAGDVDREKHARLLGEAYALLMPAGTDPLFGLSAVEANACGTPVIAFPDGFAEEIIVEGLNGFTASGVAQAVEAVARVKEISRQDCRDQAHNRFRRDRMVDDYLKAYAHILAKNQEEAHRPWGYYEILSDRADHKVKRIVVLPGKRLSLQRHNQRGEFWTIVSGNPLVTVDRTESILNPGDSIKIPLGVTHRIANPGDDPVVFIEVQVGDYFGEDDIERFEDDFGRELGAARTEAGR